MGHIQYPYHLLHQVVHHMHRKQMIDAHFHPQSSKRCFSRIIISWKGDPSNHLLLHVTHPCLEIKAIYTKSRGSRRIRLLLLSEKVFFLSTWDLRSLKLRLTSFMKTVTSLVSWASVSSQIVFFLLSKTETWLWMCAHLNLTPNFDPIWRVEHDPQLGGKPAAPGILLHHYTSHKYGLKVNQVKQKNNSVFSAYFVKVKRGVGSFPGPSGMPNCVGVSIPGIL